MIATIFLSSLFGLVCLACLACASIIIRRWHGRELGGDASQWHSVRRIARDD